MDLLENVSKIQNLWEASTKMLTGLFYYERSALKARIVFHSFGSVLTISYKNIITIFFLVFQVIKEGKKITGDLGGSAKCSEFTNEIIKKLEVM